MLVLQAASCSFLLHLFRGPLPCSGPPGSCPQPTVLLIILLSLLMSSSHSSHESSNHTIQIIPHMLMESPHCRCQSHLGGLRLHVGFRCSHLAVHCVSQSSGPQFTSVQSLICVRLFVTPWTAAHQASLSITSSQSLLKLMSITLVMPSNHLILCHPLLLPPSIFPSIRVFSNESALHIRWPEYWSFSFNISPSNEHLVLISFKMDWLDPLAVQGTLKSLLQHHSSKASVLQCSAF